MNTTWRTVTLDGHTFEVDGNGFPVEVCGRCGGTGKHQYNQLDGDKCYGCNGTTRTHGKSAAVLAPLTEYRETRDTAKRPLISQVEVGDRIRTRGAQYGVWRTVIYVRATAKLTGWCTVGSGATKRMTGWSFEHLIGFENEDGTREWERLSGNQYTERARRVDPAPFVERARTAYVKLLNARAKADARKAVKAAAQAKADAAAEAARVAASAEWMAANTDLVAALAPHHCPGYEDAPFDEFLTELAAYTARGVALTEAQTAAAREALGKLAAEQAAIAAQRYAGRTDDEVTVTGTVTRQRWFDGQYGASLLTVITGTGDDAGITITTWSKAASIRAADEGDTVTITGTVSKHKLYDDTKQTEVTYPKLTIVAAAS